MCLQAFARFQSSQKQWFSLLRWFQRKKKSNTEQKNRGGSTYIRRCISSKLIIKGGRDLAFYPFSLQFVFFYFSCKHGCRAWKKYLQVVTPFVDTWFKSRLVKYTALGLRDNAIKPPLAIHALCIFSCMGKGCTKPSVQLLSGKVIFTCLMNCFILLQ